MTLQGIKRGGMYAVKIRDESQNIEVVPTVLVLPVFQVQRKMHIK
jgi:hypothetical protein